LKWLPGCSEICGCISRICRFPGSIVQLLWYLNKCYSIWLLHL
jgi:hypothetical protein